MKYLDLSFIMVFWALNSCTPDHPAPTLHESYWGEASALQNGKLWTVHPACWIDIIDKKNLVVDMDSFFLGSRSYYLKESLIVAKIPLELGEYTVHKLQVNSPNVRSSLGIWEDDQPLGGYELVEADSLTNKISLVAYDSLTKEVKGTFNLTFKVTKRPYPSYPDTIRFTNGIFHGKILPK